MEHRCAPVSNVTDSLAAYSPYPGDNRTRVHYGKCGIDVISNFTGDVIRQELGCLNGMEYDKPKDFSIITEVGRSACTLRN